jgi:SEC-C motif-containing protein
MSLCPCGSEIEFYSCCLPIIEGGIKANSPEQLMRSRYSAYAGNFTHYIYNSYAKSSKKNQSIDEISSWAKETRWLRLDITDSSPFKKVHITNQRLPTVNFTAYYRHENNFFQMSENSRFILEDQQWRYMDGDVAEHVQLATPNRNDLCICKSGKKFKVCCANK